MKFAMREEFASDSMYSILVQVAIASIGQRFRRLYSLSRLISNTEKSKWITRTRAAWLCGTIDSNKSVKVLEFLPVVTQHVIT